LLLYRNLSTPEFALIGVMNTCILHDWLVPEQLVILFVPKRIIVYIVLKLNIELYHGETRLLLLELTQFLLRVIQYIILDMSTDINTNIIATEIVILTGIKK